MTGRRRLGLVAASATLLSAAPLSAIFDTWTWLMQCILVVGMIAGAAVLARTMRFPVWAQALTMILVLLLMLTWMFPSGQEVLGVLPSLADIEHFGELLSQAGTDTRAYGVPVPDRDGLLFVTALGIGSVSIAVDLITVVLRRPALAGLPMLAIYSVPVAVYVDSVPVLPFIIGAIGFLWLLVADNVDRVRRFGRRFTGDGRDVDVWEPSPLAAAGRRLAVIGVAAAVLLPLAVPGITTGLLSRLTQSGAGAGGVGAGGSGRINLFASLSGQLTQTETRVLVKVTTNEPDPYYLRVGVADVVTNQGFGSRSNSGKTLALGLPDPRTEADTENANFTEYHAKVEATELDQALAPVYSNTIKVDGLNRDWYYDPEAQAVYSRQSTTRGRTFDIDYVRAKYTPAQLRTASPLAANDSLRARLTTVPSDDEVNNVVQGLIKGKTTDYDKIRAIYDHFSRDNGFSYSQQTQTGTSGSDIAAFLKNKVGYCQQYAAAMAWMVRVAGIPARVAFGFTRGTKQGNTYVLTNRNAHAWTEVYLDGFGWIPFDATPAANVAGSSRSDWAPDTDRPAPTASASGASAAPETDPSAAAPNTERPDGANDPGAFGGGGDLGTTQTSWVSLLIASIAALIIVLLLVPAVRRALTRRRRHHATVPKNAAVIAAGAGPPGSRDVTVTVETLRAREDAHAAWDELIDTMIDFRVPVDPTETPRHTAQRLVREAELAEAPAGSAALLGRAEERARYARQPLQGSELPKALSQVRKGLARNSTRWTRIVAVLMPPSVLLRWRLGTADWSARWVGRFGRIRERNARFNPRRMLANRSR